MGDKYFTKKDVRNILIEKGIIEETEWNNKRTYRKILRCKKTEEGEWDGIEIAKVDDTQARQQKCCIRKRKMPAYTQKGFYPKYERENKGYRKSGFPNTSKRHKEMIHNANRSMKKTVRQQFKKELRAELNEINTGLE